MNLRTLVGKLQFWKPKAERIAAKQPNIPETGIDVHGGMRLLHRLRNSLWGRVASQEKQREDEYYGGACQSHHHKRRGYTRPAIRPSDIQREIKASRKPAKNTPHGVEKQRCFVPDPVTGRLTEKWLRPNDQPEGTIHAGYGVTLEHDPALDEPQPVAAD